MTVLLVANRPARSLFKLSTQLFPLLHPKEVRPYKFVSFKKINIVDFMNALLQFSYCSIFS